ncbi:MAG: zinc ribbon domain-containing protein [Spirochaetia bacterium]|jgi:hypothetical protein|nr:zinc ribbon domain-containing protein [Spirochaetia bacterium]
MKCKKCRTEIPEDAQFCYHCGWEVPQEPPPKKSLPLKAIAIGAAALFALIAVWRIAA